jgi:hypothetical protein
MRHPWTEILLLLPLVIGHAQDRTVLLATHLQTGNLEVLDPDTLLPFGSIKVLPLADGVVGGSEEMLFLRDGIGPDFNGCCALYALDLKTRNMTKLLDPAGVVVVSPDGKHVISQRGRGIESFNVHTLHREPGIPSPIAADPYRSLCFSRDGRLLFGTSNLPTLDVFDFNRRTRVRRFALPEGFAFVGACADNAYYLLGVSYGLRKALSSLLWRVEADGSAIEMPMSINFPETTPECEFQPGDIVAAGDLLFLAEIFRGNASKADLRTSCDRGVNGGVLLVDPKTGQVKNHFAPELHFGQLISSADGKELYGIDLKDPTWKAVGLVLLDSASGRILARRDLVSEHMDVRHLELSTISPGSVPQGQVDAIAK